jgi:hypothetical protein
MDLNVSTFRIVKTLTEENKDNTRSSAGRAGGKAGGPARAAKLSPERMRDIALKANRARWKRKEDKV